MTDHFKTEQEITAVVEGFENCTTSKEEFSHLSHLTVATYYLCNSTPEESLEKMRVGLLRFLDHHGIDRAKYDETLTIFWIKLIQSTIEGIAEDTPSLELTNAVLQQLGDSHLTHVNKHLLSLDVK